jgi:hypothetical protein
MTCDGMTSVLVISSAFLGRHSRLSSRGTLCFLQAVRNGVQVGAEGLFLLGFDISYLIRLDLRATLICVNTFHGCIDAPFFNRLDFYSIVLFLLFVSLHYLEDLWKRNATNKAKQQRRTRHKSKTKCLTDKHQCLLESHLQRKTCPCTELAGLAVH